MHDICEDACALVHVEAEDNFMGLLLLRSPGCAESTIISWASLLAYRYLFLLQCVYPAAHSKTDSAGSYIKVEVLPMDD